MSGKKKDLALNSLKSNSSSNFFHTKKGIIITLVLFFLFLTGVFAATYYLTTQYKPNQTSNNTNNPTPTPTSSITPTSSTTSTPIPIATQAPIAGKFTVVHTADEALQPSYSIKLGDEVVKKVVEDPTGCDYNIPVPIVSSDGTKVYFVDKASASTVIEMDTQKKEKTFYTAPDQYKLVVGIALNSKGKFAYTIVDKLTPNCEGGDYNDSKAAFVIDGKIIPQTTKGLGGSVYEVVNSFGETYFVSSWELSGIGIGGGASTIHIRKAVDASLVKAFSGAAVIYNGTDYTLAIDGFRDTRLDDTHQNIFKIDLNTSTITYILSDTYIQEFKIVGNKFVITYGGSINEDGASTGETKTLEYQL